MLGEDHHDVGQHAEREQVHRQPPPGGQAVTGDDPHRDCNAVDECDPDGGRDRRER
ncbi:MAG: hypothetical protein KY460_01810 [Actinobacteria bacterium]|nr:hypothetical protein [Actinomycetota bacterium]